MKTDKNTVPLVLKQKVSMDENTKWGVFCGIAGGMTQWVAQINAPFFIGKLVEAGVTAFVCGILGAAGKHLYDLLKPKVKKLWRK